MIRLPWRLRWACQVAPVVKNLPANAGDVRDTWSVPGSGRSPGGGHGSQLQDSCLENPKDRGVWWGMVQCHKDSEMTEETLHTCMEAQTIKKNLPAMQETPV